MTASPAAEMTWGSAAGGSHQPGWQAPTFESWAGATRDQLRAGGRILMSVTKIPAPSGRVGVITDYRRVAMSVAVDGQNVVYQFDEADPDLRVHVRVIDPRSRGLLGEVGPSAVSGELGDGEAILGETVQLGTPAEQALALAAIPHIYRELRDPRERKALRGLYNRLASAAADR